jgi:hypothetical protein
MAEPAVVSNVGEEDHHEELEAELDAPEIEVEAELEGGGDEEGGEEGEGNSARACEGLPAGLAGDTPSGGQPVIAKLLISNAAAGSVIGKVR